MSELIMTLFLVIYCVGATLITARIEDRGYPIINRPPTSRPVATRLGKILLTQAQQKSIPYQVLNLEGA